MLESMSLRGRVALVTGGNGGLGKAIAAGLIAGGATTTVSGRDRAKNSNVREKIDGLAEVFELDVRDEMSAESVISEIVTKFGRLDVLINCAGSFRGGAAVELSLDDWEEVISSHLTGTFICLKVAAKAMIQGGRGGKIINIGSMYSLFGAPDFADYAAAKAGVLGLTRSFAVELGRHHIQVNAILPGWYETDLTRGMPETATGEEIRRRTPAGRWGRPDDLVAIAVLLASPASDFISGACIPVDGG
ncbi:MAG TPA: SDR family NAD(P)-dependent oxidoreductase, partial [Dehalococcoidia bacterium]|nr:SDR family NAD(P)-dependent oxidoreductase [Dehalococcoidia bacterium]